MQSTSRRPLATLATLAAAVALVLGVGAAPASAASRVSVANVNGDAVIDPTYATTLTLRGSGFQSIKNGHGGIYVLFGVVKGTWKPSAGGGSGRNYLTVPDSQTKDNAGYAKFVAFPGSDTAGSANGGTIASDGSWSTRLTVPGATFSTVDASGKTVTVDCRVSRCGVITIGAHGVVNAHNETFTPVRVGRVVGVGTTSSQTVDGAATPSSSAGTGSTAAPATSTGAPVPQAVAATPALEVDRASAKPGHVLSFTAEGLAPGTQVAATFEDGDAAVGPLSVDARGQVAGVLRLPSGLTTGTYELRIVGGDDPPSVRFAVVAAAHATEDVGTDPKPVVFAVSAGAVLVLAVVAAFVIRRKKAVRA